MTVKELIKLLEELPSDSEIIAPKNWGGVTTRLDTKRHKE